FRADVIAYNMGLPGGDRYPLGGTPGFGFANFLIVGRAVSSLRDPFPFGIFYLLLVPLCLLLLRLVLREGTLAAALAAGSAALLASLYFSRVVHPNYLVLAAVLLPLAFLMGHRAATEVAVAPLLLLAAAVEMVEGEVFRATWAQALPPHPLAVDPFGLATAAAVSGIAVAALAASLLARLTPPGPRRLVLAVSMLSPAMALGIVFGSPQPVVLAGVAGGALFARERGMRMRIGLLAGGLLTALAITVVS